MMGNPPAILYSSLDLMEPAENSPSESLPIKDWEFPEAMRRRQERRLGQTSSILGCKRRPIIGMRRRVLLRGCRRPMDGLERKLHALQGLVSDGENMSLDGLFRRTADYIMCLEMKVKVMQIMVEVLTDSSK